MTTGDGWVHTISFPGVGLSFGGWRIGWAGRGIDPPDEVPLAGKVVKAAPTMPRITADEVREIAGLTRLRLDEAEIQRLTHDLDGILGHIDAVRNLDTGNVEPMTHAVPFDCPMREDVPGTSLTVEEALQNAIRRKDGFFEVPRIMPGTGGA